MSRKSPFVQGLKDGLPICLGYLSVSFAFGIFASGAGLSAIRTLLISMTNCTSAGQLAAVPIIVASGSLTELVFTQLIINLRYSLMSISISQKFGEDISLFDRFVLAFVNTDEVFGVASSKDGRLGRSYMYGLILPPYVGWSAGTLIGALAGNVFPESLTTALGVAIYGMFIAICLPAAKKDAKTALCILTAIAFSCAFRFIPALKGVPEGFVIVISACLSGAIFALVDCLAEKKGGL